jgi:hypothetical protein
MKIRPEGAELFHMDGRTYITKLTVAFRSFAHASKSQSETAVYGHNPPSAVTATQNTQLHCVGTRPNTFQ